MPIPFLFDNDGELLIGAEFTAAFAAIPADVTKIFFINVNLYEKNGAELARAFAAIPAHVTTMGFQENNSRLLNDIRQCTLFEHILISELQKNVFNMVGYGAIKRKVSLLKEMFHCDSDESRSVNVSVQFINDENLPNQ